MFSSFNLVLLMTVQKSNYVFQGHGETAGAEEGVPGGGTVLTHIRCLFTVLTGIRCLFTVLYT